MNPVILLVAFGLGALYGRMIGMPSLPSTIVAGAAIAVLLGNYPYYSLPFVSVTYAAALAGALTFGGRMQ